jgi:hypothetical protein
MGSVRLLNYISPEDVPILGRSMWKIVMFFVIMAHAFQPLENIGHIEVYRQKIDL